MNTAFGIPEHLPFDLKDRSHPIQYSLVTKADPGYKAKLKKLTDDLIEPLRLCLKHYTEKVVAGKTERRATKEQQQRERTEQKWRDFLKLFRLDFRGMITSRVQIVGEGQSYREPDAHVAISIIPLAPLAMPLDMGEIENKRPQWLRPMDASGWNTELYGKSIVHHDGSSPRSGREQEPTTVVELTEGGEIYAAAVIRVGRYGEDTRAISFERHERGLLTWINRYIGVLRELGLNEALEIRMALKGTSNTFLLPQQPFYWADFNFRPLTKDLIELGPITIPPGSTTPSIQEIAEHFRPTLMAMWRDAGVVRDPCFDVNGNYITNPA